MPAPQTPVVLEDGAPPSVKTATFRDYRQMLGTPSGAKLAVAADGQSVFVVGADGSPLSGALDRSAVYALAKAFEGRKTIRVTL